MFGYFVSYVYNIDYDLLIGQTNYIYAAIAGNAKDHPSGATRQTPLNIDRELKSAIIIYLNKLGMKKLLFLIAFGVIATTAMSAQEFKTEYDDTQGTFERVSKRGPYLTGRFFDNWFISVAGGVNMYMSDGDDDADFTDRLAPAIDAYIGKWITPTIGFRVGYSGMTAKGASPVETAYTKGTLQDNKYYEKEFDFWSAQGHILWNISNTIGGYRADRFWDFIPYGGFGYMEASKNGSKTRDGVGYAGLLNQLRVSKVIDVTIDARIGFMKPGMDIYNDDKDMDNMVSLTAGLSFNIGRNGFKRPMQVAPADYTPYQQRISALESDLSAEKAKSGRLAKDLEECLSRPVAPPTKVEVEVVAPASMQVFFKIGSTKIAETDMANIENIATTIKATPGKVYTVTGSADAATGSAATNARLSNQRAKNVADALVNRFGIDRNQLEVDSKGGISSGGNPEMDRAVIIEMKK